MPLYSMAIADGSITNLGGSLKDICDITFKQSGSVLYGLSTHAGGQLFTIDTSNGATTKIGGGTLGNITDLFFDNDDGILYGYSPLDGGSIYSIDQSTAAPTLVVNRGVSGLSDFTCCESLGSGVGLFYRQIAAVVDVLATGEVVVTATIDTDVRSIARDNVNNRSYVLRPRRLFRFNEDDSQTTIATEGLGTMRAMAYDGSANLFLVG